MGDPLLSPREKQLLRRIAKRMSDAAIATDIGGTAAQITDQRERLLTKLGLKSQGDIDEAAQKLASWPRSTQASR
jgi:DNA-binding CsgD family transcriptional regulator